MGPAMQNRQTLKCSDSLTGKPLSHLGELYKYCNKAYDLIDNFKISLKLSMFITTFLKNTAEVKGKFLIIIVRECICIFIPIFANLIS